MVLSLCTGPYPPTVVGPRSLEPADAPAPRPPRPRRLHSTYGPPGHRASTQQQELRAVVASLGACVAGVVGQARPRRACTCAGSGGLRRVGRGARLTRAVFRVTISAPERAGVVAIVEVRLGRVRSATRGARGSPTTRVLSAAPVLDVRTPTLVALRVGATPRRLALGAGARRRAGPRRATTRGRGGPQGVTLVVSMPSAISAGEGATGPVAGPTSATLSATIG